MTLKATSGRLALLSLPLLIGSSAHSEDLGKVSAPDLARVKQQEAREKLERLEEAMDRLARSLVGTEPQNAAKLKLAFGEARDRLLREGMDRVVKYLSEHRLDRAIEDQGQLKINLEELLNILLEKDIDPRELLRHIRRVREIVQDLDRVIEQVRNEQINSSDAGLSGAATEALQNDLATLEGLIRRQKEVEKGAKDPANASKAALGKLAPQEDAIRGETRRLREGNAEREEGAKAQPASTRAEGALDRKKLEEAEAALTGAARSLREGDAPASGEKTTEARALLEEATAQAEKKLERLRAMRDFRELKDAQDSTKKDVDAVARKMHEPLPLISTPEVGVPGKKEVEAASIDIREASQGLGEGKPREASGAQSKSLDKLRKGREKAEEALEELQKALRDRILAHLLEKFTQILNDQRAITRETRSLNLKLRALQATSAASGSESFEPDRKDRQTAEALASRETALTLVADDVMELLAEDGTTRVFPGVVEEVKVDLARVSGLLSRTQTDDATQQLQDEIETALEDILKALEKTQRSPPPPNPGQGRGSKSGAGPLLPLSTELQLVRDLQHRVNERTKSLDLKRKPTVKIGPEGNQELGLIKKKQAEVESMLRKIQDAAGER